MARVVGTIVYLDTTERNALERVAQAQDGHAKDTGLKRKARQSASVSLEHNVIGALGHYAVCAYLRVPFVYRIGAYSEPDILRPGERSIEVKTSRDRRVGVRCYVGDPPRWGDVVFIGVRAEEDQLTILGWTLGADIPARCEGRLSKLRGATCWRVPPDRLEELPKRLHEFRPEIRVETVAAKPGRTRRRA